MISDKIKSAFNEQCLSFNQKKLSSKTIGELNEHSIHAVIKRYIDSNSQNQEVVFKTKIADIRNSEGIYEIQTRSFGRLNPKLREFLPDEKVFIIYPVKRNSRINYVDIETGMITHSVLSPKHIKKTDVFSELYFIRKYLNHPNLYIQLYLLNCDDYKYKKKNGKSIKIDSVPNELIDIINLKSPNDYLDLLDVRFPHDFSSKILSPLLQCSSKTATCILGVLRELKVIIPFKKSGNTLLYHLTEDYKEYEQK